jgi:hypothetical protein
VREHRTRLKEQEIKWPPTKTRRLTRARLWARTGPQTPRWRPPAAGDWRRPAAERHGWREMAGNGGAETEQGATPAPTA